MVLLTFGIRAYVVSKVVLNSNKKVHDDAVENLVRSPQSYFDKTSEGLIMNHISSDLGVLDNVLNFFSDEMM